LSNEDILHDGRMTGSETKWLVVKFQKCKVRKLAKQLLTRVKTKPCPPSTQVFLSERQDQRSKFRLPLQNHNLGSHHVTSSRFKEVSFVSIYSSEHLLYAISQIHSPKPKLKYAITPLPNPRVSTFQRRRIRPLTTRSSPIERRPHTHDRQGNEQHCHEPPANLLRLFCRCAI
jgi:hypothetical protein